MSQVEIIDVDLSNRQQMQAVVDLLDMYAREPTGMGAPLADEVKAALPGKLREQPGTHLLLAMLDGAAVGLAVCFMGLSTFFAKPRMNIHDLAVSPAARGQGIGEKLLVAVDRKSRELGCCKITLEVRDDNPARRLYLRHGYDPGKPGEDAMGYWTKTL